MIIIDSREKKFEHIKAYFDKHGIPYEVRKLNTGDYFNTDNPSVVVDRKANLQEVCSNLSAGKSNRIRFTDECKRAFAEHIRKLFFHVFKDRWSHICKTWKKSFPLN